MFLFCLTACSVFFGGSFAQDRYVEKCYGGSYELPYRYRPSVFKDQLYFTPSAGGSRRVVLDKGEIKDPRFKESHGSLQISDLRESDAGKFSAAQFYLFNHDVINLRIIDCSISIVRYYGNSYTFEIPGEAGFLEYSRLESPDQTTVLWNRTNPDASKGGRGKLRRNSWLITHLTQADNGYYNVRTKDNRLLSRSQLTVQENEVYHDVKVKHGLSIQNPSPNSLWSVDFIPKGELHPITLIREGELLLNSWDARKFAGRILVQYDAVKIDPMQITDTGMYVFKDSEGNQAQTAFVSVTEELTPTLLYVAIIASVVVGVIVLVCCIRRCCCKKSSSKRATLTRAVYYHDQSQPTNAGYSAAPAGPSYSAAPAQSFSYDPWSPAVLPNDSETTSFPPSVAAPAPKRTTIAAALDTDFLSSESEPTFVPKGLSFPSAPLSSDSNLSHVYNSDKLNFASREHLTFV